MGDKVASQQMTNKFVALVVALLLGLAVAQEETCGCNGNKDTIVNVALPACCASGVYEPANLLPIIFLDSGDDTIAAYARAFANLFYDAFGLETAFLSVSAETLPASLERVIDSNIHLVIGPVDCAAVQIAVDAVSNYRIASKLMFIIPASNCTTVDREQDSVFMFDLPHSLHRHNSLHQDISHLIATNAAYAPEGHAPVLTHTGARVFDSFLAIIHALGYPEFREAVVEEVPGMRNKLFLDIASEVTGTAGWLGMDDDGNILQSLC